MAEQIKTGALARSVRRRWMMGAVATAVGLLAGCATGGGQGGEAALKERAAQYWELVRTNDRVKAWSYEEISQSPDGSLEGYLKRGGITFDAVEVRNVRELTGDKAVLDVFMRYSVPQLRIKDLESTTQDEWRRINGVWYHVLRKSVMLPDSKS